MDRNTTMGGVTSEQSAKEWEARKKLDNTPFAEITTEQKIDRLVSYIRNFDYLNNRIDSVEFRTSRLENHSHSGTGQVVVPIVNNNGLGNVTSGSLNRIGRHPLD